MLSRGTRECWYRRSTGSHLNSREQTFSIALNPTLWRSSIRHYGGVSDLSWDRPFDRPVPLPCRAPARTLYEAAQFIITLPKSQRDRPEWRLAIHLLIDAAEDRGTMLFARLGILRAMESRLPMSGAQPTLRHVARPSWRSRQKKSPYG
jgi:hypothetical protein